MADRAPFEAEGGWTMLRGMLGRAGLRGSVASGRLAADPAGFDPALADSRDVTAGIGIVLRGDPLDFAFDAERVLAGRNSLAGTRLGFSIWRAGRPRTAKLAFQSGGRP